MPATHYLSLPLRTRAAEPSDEAAPRATWNSGRQRRRRLRQQDLNPSDDNKLDRSSPPLVPGAQPSLDPLRLEKKVVQLTLGVLASGTHFSLRPDPEVDVCPTR